MVAKACIISSLTTAAAQQQQRQPTTVPAAFPMVMQVDADQLMTMRDLVFGCGPCNLLEETTTDKIELKEQRSSHRQEQTRAVQ
jgi:hypothetical protein